MTAIPGQVQLQLCRDKLRHDLVRISGPPRSQLQSLIGEHFSLHTNCQSPRAPANGQVRQDSTRRDARASEIAAALVTRGGAAASEVSHTVCATRFLCVQLIGQDAQLSPDPSIQSPDPPFGAEPRSSLGTNVLLPHRGFSGPRSTCRGSRIASCSRRWRWRRKESPAEFARRARTPQGAHALPTSPGE